MPNSASGLLALVPLLAGTAAAPAWSGWTPGSLVSVEVSVEGRDTRLYPAPDGSGRWYLEAREGARYAIRLTNRTSERLGVALCVDGLNVISGERLPASGPPGDPGRMYVLDPWDAVDIRGWRTSLRDVRRFVFVDERASYAARIGQANARMGWIELAVYRERYPRAARVWPLPLDSYGDEARWPEGPAGKLPAPDRAEADRPSAELPPPAVMMPQVPPPYGPGSALPSYPGTGWGPRANDPAELVEFDPQAHPAERVTLRYEYRQALLALGIDLGGRPPRDRLWERERGEHGFAKPPRW